MIRIITIVTIVLCCTTTLVCSYRSNKLYDLLWDHTYTNNPSPAIRTYSIKTNVRNRFAETMVTSVVFNNHHYPRKNVFSVVIPEAAFITKFTMEINNKMYESFVVRINEAHNYINNTDNNGAHVTVRNSNEFDLTVNLEPFSTTVFKLHYEELLERKKGRYEIIANVFPRQLVENLSIEVLIKEDEEIAYIMPPYLKTGDTILKNQTDYKANVYLNISSHTGYIKFTPGMVNQFKLACDGLRGIHSFAAQFVVEYDVVRSSPSQVLTGGGFFVTYFSPPNLKPLEQHIIFVLDKSGSMSLENRITHLKEAMHLILDTVSAKDVFNIIAFNAEVEVWNIEDPVEEKTICVSCPATKENIQKAKNSIDNLNEDGSTNIYDALKTALNLIATTQKDTLNAYTSKIIFLTDGAPTASIEDTDLIISEITHQNYNLKAPIYTISLGEGANRTFLRNLALYNDGFETHIYDGTDKQLQLKDFYDKIKSPVLKNIQFKNLNDITDMTMSNVPLLFDGAEIIVAGKGGHWKVTKKGNTSFITTGQTNNGTIEYKPSVKVPSEKLDRLWAYTYVKQLLKDSVISKNPEELKNKATDVAIAYSLVTDVTMLIARGLPDGNSSINLIRDYEPRKTIEQDPLCRNVPWPATTRSPLIYTRTVVTTSAPTDKYSFSTRGYTDKPTTNSSLYIPTTNLPYTNGYKTTNRYVTFNPGSTTKTIPSTIKAPKKIYSPDACLLKSDPGPCRAYTTKFTFDKNFGVCRQFKYGGCLGNENNFDSLEECRKNCVTMENFAMPATARSPLIYTTSSSTETILSTTKAPKKIYSPDACLLKSDPGPCRAYTNKFTFDKNFGVCRQFKYGGCLGNENNFDSLEECRKNCVTMEHFDKCSLPAMRGPCSSNLTKWYFDVSSNECKEFSYGGCRGNSNKFENKNDCERDCIKTKEKDECQFMPEFNAPDCGISRQNYFYNGAKCLPFKYTGCNEFQKGFESLDECKISCEKSSVNCGYSFDPGHCYNFTNQWYFDANFGSCIKFSYSGCGGNANRFETEQECNQVCRFVDTIDKCNLPKSPGTCTDVTKRWYHDHEKQTCLEFDYHCYGNSNNFFSQDECLSNCNK